MPVAIESMENAALPQDIPLADDTDIGSEMYYLDAKGNVTFGRVGRDEDGVGSETRRYLRHGWKALDAYGTFKIRPYHVDRPFEVLFLRGGAKELPVRQIIDQGFHFRPPLVPRCGVTVGEGGHVRGNRRNMKLMAHTEECWAGARPVVFPQMEGQEVAGPFECRWCFEEDGEARMFATTRGRDEHQSVMHKDMVGSDRLGSQLIQGLGGYTAPSTADLDLRGEMLKLQEQLDEVLARANQQVSLGEPVAPAEEPEWLKQPYICGIHREGFPSRYQMDKHMTTHAKDPVAA